MVDEPVEVRPVRDDELAAMVRTDFRAFGVSLAEVDRGVERLRSGFEVERFVVAAVEGEIVGNGGAYSFELTLPGDVPVPVSAVTWIAVLPTHRRRGVMRSVMDALVADARDRGEVATVLIASEGSIYSHVGYGPAAVWRAATIDTRRAAFVDPVPRGRVRYVDPEDVLAAIAPIHDAVRRVTPGELSRTDAWWRSHALRGKDPLAAFVVHEDSDGRRDGYAAYTVTEDWGLGQPRHRADVVAFGASNADAHADLWRFLLSLDLVGELRTFQLAPDDPLPLLLADPRLVRTSEVNDSLWVRLLDVPRWFGSRRYRVSDEIVVEVTGDEAGVSGRWRISGGPDHGAVAPSSSAPDVRTSPAALSGVALGAASVHQFARAGRIEACTPDAAGRLARFLGWEPLPYCGTQF